jgi:hypothetical protein
MEEQIRRTEKEVEIGNRPKSDVYDIKGTWELCRSSGYLPRISGTVKNQPVECTGF